MRVTNEPGGGHDIVSDRYDPPVVLVRVRPVGTLEMGELSEFFVSTWVPEFVEALLLAQRVADREKPWEPWTGDEVIPASYCMECGKLPRDEW